MAYQKSTNSTTQPWIKAGYQLFALKGPSSLKIEVLSRMVKKNKSSFYHHFVDLEIFTSQLLEHHLERAKIVMQAEREAKNVVPELVNVLVNYKQDLLFNRQLRVHKNNKAFNLCYNKASADSIDAISGIWAKYLAVSEDSKLANLVLVLSIENFFLQITEDTLTYDWLKNYAENIRRMTKNVQRINSDKL